ncbi:prepilin-type N-terminal cleavage/methylation domain-containing protein [Hydrogenimonas sp.]
MNESHLSQISTLNTQHSILTPLRGAFTLVELLVVLLLMGIVYGLVFDAAIPRGEEKAAGRPTLRTVESLARNSPSYRQTDIFLYGTKNGEVLVVADGKIQRRATIPQHAMGYRLNPDETLQSIDYGRVRIGTVEFRPLFTLRCRKDGLFDPQILLDGETWYYVHPGKGVEAFGNPVALIAHMRQSDYLPDRAGYAQ